MKELPCRDCGKIVEVDAKSARGATSTECYECQMKRHEALPEETRLQMEFFREVHKQNKVLKDKQDEKELNRAKVEKIRRENREYMEKLKNRPGYAEMMRKHREKVARHLRWNGLLTGIGFIVVAANPELWALAVLGVMVNRAVNHHINHNV